MNTGESNLDGAEALLGECDWLRRLARSLVSDAARAEDAVQETLAAALQSTPSDEAPNRSWLSRVLRNALAQDARGRVRREDREALSEPRTESPASDKIAERMELQRKVFESVNALEPIYRDVIVLRYFDGLPPREIAKQLDRPVKTVHTRIARALEMLRGKLDEDFEGGRSAWLAALVPFALGEPTVPVIPNSVSTAVSPAIKFAVVAALVVVGLAIFPYEEPEENSTTAEFAPQEEVELQEEHVPAELEEPEAIEALESNESRIPLVAAEGEDLVGPPSSVSGRVVNEAGEAMRVEVWAMRAEWRERIDQFKPVLIDPSYEPRVILRRHTDENGLFEINDLEQGDWIIGPAPNPEYVSLAHLVYVREEPAAVRLKTVRGAPIFGRVAAEGGVVQLPGNSVSLGDTFVEVLLKDMWGTVKVSCDAEGRYETRRVPHGEYSARWTGLSADGRMAFRSAFEVTTGKANFYRQPAEAALISGIVRDSRTGEPVKGKVTLVSQSGSRSSTTNQDPVGTFRFEGIERTIYTVRASRLNGDVAVLSNVDFRNGESITDLELFLEPGAHYDLTLEGPRDRCRVAFYWNGTLVDDFTLKKPTGNSLSLPAGPILIEAYVHENGQRVSLGETSLTAVAGTQNSLVITVDR